VTQLDQALTEWQSKPRRMVGCVAATRWLCNRVHGFEPIRRQYYTADGDVYEHVTATNGLIEIDLAPYANGPAL
jgi:hypothetical protein